MNFFPNRKCMHLCGGCHQSEKSKSRVWERGSSRALLHLVYSPEGFVLVANGSAASSWSKMQHPKISVLPLLNALIVLLSSFFSTRLNDISSQLHAFSTLRYDWFHLTGYFCTAAAASIGCRCCSFSTASICHSCAFFCSECIAFRRLLSILWCILTIQFCFCLATDFFCLPVICVPRNYSCTGNGLLIVLLGRSPK